jgi:hypothetical protein
MLWRLRQMGCLCVLVWCPWTWFWCPARPFLPGKGVDYDAIGLSFYPFWGAGSLNNVAQLAQLGEVAPALASKLVRFSAVWCRATSVL